jgi:glycosyltransferase involved in cell wall biosynthesis
MADLAGRVDFHLHSHASNVTDYYAANAFAIPESYSEPLVLYDMLRSRGMNLFTLTDHNSIDGVKELLDKGRPNVFVSSELTCTFPEDGCRIHLTVANMTEAQFAEANRLRANIYDLVTWLDLQIAGESERPGTNRLAYFMTHPLMSTQNRPYGREGSLALRHIEKMLVLFNAFEIQNGSRTRALNDLTARLLDSVDSILIERLADRHNLTPKGATPWRKTILSGSDDHAGINPGRTWTEFPCRGETPTVDELIGAMRARQTSAGGIHGGPVTLANSLLKLMYSGSQHSREPRGPAGRVAVRGPVLALLRLVFDSSPGGWSDKMGLQLKRTWWRLTNVSRSSPSMGTDFERLLESEVYRLLDDAAFLTGLRAIKETDDRIFLVVTTLVNRIFLHYIRALQNAGTANLVSVIKEIVTLVSSTLFVSLPYLVSFLQQSSDSLISRDVRKAFNLNERPRVALVTDTFFEINGVSASIRRMIREAIRRDIPFTVITCLAESEYESRTSDPEVRSFMDQGRLKLLPSVANLDFPEYDDLQVRFPPLLDLLKYLQEGGFTKIQISTPGIIGLAGLAAGKILQIETAATYHTSVPEYVENYTKDLSLEALAWKYMILFYHSVDEVLVPSKYIARLLHRRGLRNRKLLILDRWVDVDRFHPSKRTPGFWKTYGLENEDALVKFVYVGRVGVEKNLSQVAEAYRRLHGTRPNAHLIIVGDGPYREELERQLEGLPATFTGFVEGEALARAMASADVKVFPSITDTWGNAPLEAQASGLPVIVSDIGGPAELMIDGETGIRIPGRDVGALYRAMEALMDPLTRTRMSHDARVFAERNRVDEPFTAILDAAAYRRRLEGEDRDNPRVTVQILDVPDEDGAPAWAPEGRAPEGQAVA